MTNQTPFHLPRPRLSIAQAIDLARVEFGVTGTVTELGSHQDRNFLIKTTRGSVVLKVANAATATIELEAQNAALAHLENCGLDVPRIVCGRSGGITPVTVDDQRLDLRLLTFVAGEPLTSSRQLSQEQIWSLGDVAGRLVLSLADFAHPGTDRVLQWDLRRAGAVITALLPYVHEDARQERLSWVTQSALEQLGTVADDLRVQSIHGDLTDDNVVCRIDSDRSTARTSSGEQISGVIDFGDVATGWLVAELAATCACVLYRNPQHPLAILGTIEAFTRRVALSEAELTALWPLIVLRTAVLVVSGEQQVHLDGDNEYADANRAREWLAFETAAGVDGEEMSALIRFVAGQTNPLVVATDYPLAGPLDSAAIVDLSVTSPAFDAGVWLEAGIDHSVAAGVAAHYGHAITRYGGYRLSQTRLDTSEESLTLALGCEVYLAQGSALVVPFDARVTAATVGPTTETSTERWPAPRTVRLEGSSFDLWLSGVDVGDLIGQRLPAGSVLGTVVADPAGVGEGASLGRVSVQISRLSGVRPPFFVAPSTALLWQKVCPDPSALLGLATNEVLTDPIDLLERRDRTFARVQEHYYSMPPQIERGWKHYLIDTHAQSYVDMVNNVTTVGHGHPRIAEAARSQWSLLNTNSRFHYRELVTFSERLAALAPGPLDTVFLVNSGTEAVDLALRLARTYTGNDTVVAVREAYHGWSLAADAVSSSVADNPRALETRPEWVHLVEAPNAVRGKYRGMDSAPQYLNDFDSDLKNLVTDGHTVAAFIAEPVFGNAGGVLLPDGYLAGAYEQVRALGGLCIADEVQVSYARLGRYFWGTEQQNVVPDIITIAKAMGNGHPLGAVITRRDIAERFAEDGPFFSSSGGSPLSCRIGLTVLDIMRDENLQGNAESVGRHLKQGLEQLGKRFDLVGAVYGLGLYLGVELVTDRARFTPATAITARICDELLLRGCIVQPTGDFKNVLKIKPPLCLSRASADHFLGALSEVLEQIANDQDGSASGAL